MVDLIEKSLPKDGPQDQGAEHFQHAVESDRYIMYITRICMIYHMISKSRWMDQSNRSNLKTIKLAILKLHPFAPGMLIDGLKLQEFAESV